MPCVINPRSEILQFSHCQRRRGAQATSPASWRHHLHLAYIRLQKIDRVSTLTGHMVCHPQGRAALYDAALKVVMVAGTAGVRLVSPTAVLAVQRELLGRAPLYTTSHQSHTVSHALSLAARHVHLSSIRLVVFEGRSQRRGFKCMLRTLLSVVLT